jgi:hypothetical protein
VVQLIKWSQLWNSPSVVTVLWRRQAILFVKVPLASNWLISIHQDIQTFALPSIEIFHLERLLSFDEVCEFSWVTKELIRTNNGATQGDHQLARGVTVWLGESDFRGGKLTAVVKEALTHAGCDAVINVKAVATKFVRESTH